MYSFSYLEPVCCSLSSSTAWLVLSAVFHASFPLSFHIVLPLIKSLHARDFLDHLNSKESTCNAGDLGLIPGKEDPLEKRMATYSSILTLKIPWTGSLVDYSPKLTQHLSLFFFFFFACLLLCVCISEQLTNISSQGYFFMVSFKLIWR